MLPESLGTLNVLRALKLYDDELSTLPAIFWQINVLQALQLDLSKFPLSLTAAGSSMPSGSACSALGVGPLGFLNALSSEAGEIVPLPIRFVECWRAGNLHLDTQRG